jgi:hypothetical protein
VRDLWGPESRHTFNALPRLAGTRPRRRLQTAAAHQLRLQCTPERRICWWAYRGCYPARQDAQLLHTSSWGRPGQPVLRCQLTLKHAFVAAQFGGVVLPLTLPVEVTPLPGTPGALRCLQPP